VQPISRHVARFRDRDRPRDWLADPRLKDAKSRWSIATS